MSERDDPAGGHSIGRPDTLADRTAAIDRVVAYANALDARDWPRFRSLFADQVTVDYSAIGSVHQVMAADDWVDRCRVLGAFDATQHQVSNFVCAIDGESATVTAYVDAAHFLSDGGRVMEAYARGTYVHQLGRTPQGWTITGCAFHLAGHPGGREAFDAALAEARRAYAEARPARQKDGPS